MSTDHWTRVVFRLRNLPNSISSPTEAGNLIAKALNLPAQHVVVCSLATTLGKYERLPSKIATLQFMAAPACLRNAKDDEDQWTIQLSGEALAKDLILDTHFKGMTVLNDVDPVIHRADCIAISGLASHPFGSWQPRGQDKSFMWMRDEIPESVPGLRAIVYGYDSGLLGSSSFQSIADIAQGLVLHLKSGGWNLPSSKPLIFLAHSLGGLVLKQATVQAASGEESVASILDNILGAIMFGVPSLGMQQSHIMAMVEGQPNEFLVQDLSREGGSNYVRQLHAQFEGLSFLRNTRILWAFETKESPTVTRCLDGTWTRTGSPTVLVHPESATSRNHKTNPSLTIPINEDHSNMVKFRRGDATSGIIMHSLRELCSQNRSASLGIGAAIENGCKGGPLVIGGGARGNLTIEDPSVDCEGEEALRALDQLLTSLHNIRNEIYTPELDFRIDQVEDPFEGTFGWVFDVPSFRNWLREGSELFWIYGKPGCGKSTLMKLIYRSKETWELLHDWKTGALEITAGFFFHYRGTALQKSFEGVLRSLVTQILAPYYKAYLEKHETIWNQYRALKRQQGNVERQKQSLKASLQSVSVEISKIREFIESQTSQTRILSVREQDGPQFTADITDDGEASTELRNQQAELNQTLAKREQEQPSPVYTQKALKELLYDQAELETKLAKKEKEWPTVLRQIRASLTSLAARFKPYSNEPIASFLTRIVAGFSEEKHELIPRLERALRQLLDQDLNKMDLVLFFDALDEFDGHLDLISRFLKGLVQSSPSSMTSVKICFSSRPWEPLKEQFSAYPGFALHEYTKGDMEEFAARSVVHSSIKDPVITRLVPDIIVRANGVFLWVRLALKVLLETAIVAPRAGLSDLLEAKLRELPDDLFEFYKLIIGRISRSYRRQTFALLELLVRRAIPDITALEIRDAVLVSNCTSFQGAVDTLNRAYSDGSQIGQFHMSDIDGEAQAIRDIAAWGGGLVEVITHNGVGYPEFIHQTVLEFTTNAQYREVVLGDLATLIIENGHSFFLKYWSLSGMWNVADILRFDGAYRVHRRAPIRRTGDVAPLAYHAQQSEATTGMSHFKFFYELRYTPKDPTTGWPWNRDDLFVYMAASCGLRLCLRDWLDRVGPQGFSTIKLPPCGFPLLHSFFVSLPRTDFAQRHMATIELLLKNKYPVNDEHEFLKCMFKEIWENRLHPDETIIPNSVLLELAKLAVEAGADTEMYLTLNDAERRFFCIARPLHVAPPLLALELIRHGANPNCPDGQGRKPLDWVIHPPPGAPRDPAGKGNSMWLYDKCQVLIKAGSTTSPSTPREAWMDMLAHFEGEGYETQTIYDYYFRFIRRHEIP